VRTECVLETPDDFDRFLEYRARSETAAAGDARVRFKFRKKTIALQSVEGSIVACGSTEDSLLQYSYPRGQSPGN
jgi:hypothetical protein